MLQPRLQVRLCKTKGDSFGLNLSKVKKFVISSSDRCRRKYESFSINQACLNTKCILQDVGVGNL